MTTSNAAPATATPEAERFALPAPDGPHPLTKRGIWIPIAILLFVLNIPFFHYFLRGGAPVTTKIPFQDDFERSELGDNYWSTGGFARIVNGSLYSPGVKNNPLWLRAKLPHDVSVEFDVKGEAAAGDLKCEIFGNGRDHATGYILIFGGWNNTKSEIARLDEHGGDLNLLKGDALAAAKRSGRLTLSRSDRKVEKGRVYHWKVVREGSLLSWYIDGALFLEYDDPNPLYGTDNDRFALGTWGSDAYFDNLSIKPLH